MLSACLNMTDIVYRSINLIEGILLALVQALTEWFPISSSGHLVVVQQLLGVEAPLLFYIILHVATMIVTCIVFAKDLWGILKAVVRAELRGGEMKQLALVLLGNVPTGILGFLLHDMIELFFSNLLVVGPAFFVTGVIVYLSNLREGDHQVSYLDALLIGLAQGFSIIPGISRSGATIATALFRGVEREAAFKYSFLLSIPAVLGAFLLETLELSSIKLELWPLLLSFSLAVAVGYFCIKTLLRIVLRKKLHFFSYYCWVLGFIVLVVSFI